jgi:hypothetical protein
MEREAEREHLWRKPLTAAHARDSGGLAAEGADRRCLRVGGPRQWPRVGPCRRGGRRDDCRCTRVSGHRLLRGAAGKTCCGARHAKKPGVRVDRLGDRPGGEHHPGFTRTPPQHRHKEPRSPTVDAARSIDAEERQVGNYILD